MLFIKKILSLLTFLLLFFNVSEPLFVGNRQNLSDDTVNDIRPDTWAMTDGLGRKAPLKGEVREKDDSKFVGLFYWTWHTEQSEGKSAKNVTETLKKSPSAIHDFSSPIWENTYSGYPYYWDEPIYGYYLDTDEYVIRKQAELIADAGVDVIFFDCTNGTFLWKESYDKLFEVYEKAKADGINVPQISFILPFWDEDYTRTDLNNLYDDIYGCGRYKDLWFIWDGKPLILANSDGFDRGDPEDAKLLDFFTFRKNEASYFADDTFFNEKTWGWCSDYPQTKFGVSLNGNVEQMCVSVAQNASKGKLAAMNCESGAQGRDFSKCLYSYSYKYGGKTIRINSKSENAELYGVNFQQQWDYALKTDPEFIFVTGWNEWIAGRFDEWEGTKNAFPDQFNYRFSRDCEPSAGIQKDYYYCQLCENIRRFKGISNDTIEYNEEKIYYHYANNTYERNSAGWGDLLYTNDTMRNDFIKVSVSNDDKNIIMNIFTADNITPHTDNAWMRILIDTDETGISSSWEGFEYIINRDNSTEDSMSVERSTGGWSFSKTGTAVYTVNGNKMTVSIPLQSLGLNSKNCKFNFKLSDNMQKDGDIMDFYLNGDVAPGGRFTFVY